MAAGVLYPTAAEASSWGEQVSDTRGMFMGTPEIYFAKRIDNSRVVRVVDPKRRREMLSFGITLGRLFLAGDGVPAAASQRHRIRLSHRAGEGGAEHRSWRAIAN